jgi:hypothetical protein
LLKKGWRVKAAELAGPIRKELSFFVDRQSIEYDFLRKAGYEISANRKNQIKNSNEP